MADEPTRNVRVYEQKPSRSISVQTIIVVLLLLVAVGYLLFRLY